MSCVRSNVLFRELKPHIVNQFWKYHKENPKVFKLFKRFSSELKKAGRDHYGAGAVVERIRWHFAIQTSGEEFKINNNHRSCYARLLMILDPKYRKFFEIRSTPGYSV